MKRNSLDQINVDYPVHQCADYYSRVRVSRMKRQKISGLPSPRAEAGQGNIETVHEPKPIQTAGAPWGQGRRAMRGPHGPRTQDMKGPEPSR